MPSSGKRSEQPIKIEPIRGLPVVKDLIVDMEPFFDSYKKGNALSY